MRTINRLTPLDVASFQKGLHADGNGLYLQVGSKSARSWVFRYKTNGRLRELGLGSARLDWRTPRTTRPASPGRGRSAGLVERSCPIRKTVSAVPLMDRRLAPFASEAADTNARFPILHGAINRLARQATEKDAQWSLVRHRSLFAKVVGAPIAGIS